MGRQDRSGGGGIAVVGMGCRFAGAQDLHAYWEMITDGRDGFGPVPADRWDAEAFFDANPRATDKSYAPAGGFIEDVRSFPAIALQIPPRRVEVMDPQQRLGLEICLAAVEDAGLAFIDLRILNGCSVSPSHLTCLCSSSGVSWL